MDEQSLPGIKFHKMLKREREKRNYEFLTCTQRTFIAAVIAVLLAIADLFQRQTGSVIRAREEILLKGTSCV